MLSDVVVAMLSSVFSTISVFVTSTSSFSTGSSSATSSCSSDSATSSGFGCVLSPTALSITIVSVVFSTFASAANAMLPFVKVITDAKISAKTLFFIIKILHKICIFKM